MVSAAMTIQDQSECARSNAANDSPHSTKSVLFKEQFPSADDYAPKVRKTYTISKQREKWTDEEHEKFLEALKLHGRAWRRIEEHVGTKTAVQIRSHAQKFFSKVVRESISDADSAKPIEIPPPRPKRKPMHPYPRKMALPTKIGTPLSEEARRFESPTFSVSEEENQSPTSGLSTAGSNTLGVEDSNKRNGSSSPVSSNVGVNHGCFLRFESNPSLEENGSLLAAHGTDCSSPDEVVPTKFEPFPQDNAVGMGHSASTQSLKLFGKTLFVADSEKPSSPTPGTCKSQSPDTKDWRAAQALLWNFLGNSECTWSSLPEEAPAAAYCTPLHNPLPIKASPLSDDGENQGRENQKEGSSTGSNTGSVNIGRDGDKNLDVETQSSALSFEAAAYEQKPKFSFKLNEKPLLLGQRVKSDNPAKGFVPYKRCLAQRESQSSIINGEERQQRIRLCL